MERRGEKQIGVTTTPLPHKSVNGGQVMVVRWKFRSNQVEDQCKSTFRPIPVGFNIVVEKRRD